MPPARVTNPYAYFAEQPPCPSARLLYWKKRIRAGWRQNSRIKRLGYSEAARYFGVYVWEWLHVLSPLLAHTEATR